MSTTPPRVSLANSKSRATPLWSIHANAPEHGAPESNGIETFYPEFPLQGSGQLCNQREVVGGHGQPESGRQTRSLLA